MKYLIDQTAWQQIKHMHPHFWAWNRPQKIGTCHNCQHHDDCKAYVGECFHDDFFCKDWKWRK